MLEWAGTVGLGLINRALEARNPQLRLRAVNLLAGWEGAGVDKFLEVLVDGADDLVRARAVLALARWGISQNDPAAAGSDRRGG